tara:strand:+ start:190 stop:1572 length:1383 start_codon:yes stop_codon:yes gene_type:complete
MKVLNRPMFRYGGPIKEGVMSGIREPRANGGSMRNRALLVGNPAFPMRDGRAMYAEQLSLFDTVKDAAKKTIKTNPLKVLNPAKKVGLAKRIFGPVRNFYNKQIRKLDMPKDRIPSNTGMGGVQLTEGQLAAGMGTQKAGLFNKALQFAKLNPKTTGVGAGVGVSSGLIPEVAGGVGSLLKKGGLQVADLLVYDKFFDQDQYFKDKEQAKILEANKKSKETANEKRIKELEALLAADTSVNQGKTQDQIREERIQKYRDIMDIKGMNKTAAYDSLIAASQAVNQAGGDLKGAIKDGSLINQIIQSTSKAFDKPKQTKDAIDTLILKGEIEADIAAGKPSTYLKAAQDMVATGASKNITEAMKTLTKSENSMSTTLGAILAKGNRLDEKTVGVAYREETGNIPAGSVKISEVNEWKEDNKGKNEVDYVKEIMKISELTPGDYIIGERVVTVDEDKSVSFFY